MTPSGRKKTESNCLANFPRTIFQTSSLFRQSQHKQKIRDKNKRQSDLTCTKKYALTKGPRRGGGGLMQATRSAPPVILCLLRAWFLGPCGDRKIRCRGTGCRTLLHGLGYGPLLTSYCESYENQCSFVKACPFSWKPVPFHVTLPKKVKMKEKLENWWRIYFVWINKLAFVMY